MCELLRNMFGGYLKCWKHQVKKRFNGFLRSCIQLLLLNCKLCNLFLLKTFTKAYHIQRMHAHYKFASEAVCWSKFHVDLSKNCNVCVKRWKITLNLPHHFKRSHRAYDRELRRHIWGSFSGSLHIGCRL